MNITAKKACLQEVKSNLFTVVYLSMNKCECVFEALKGYGREHILFGSGREAVQMVSIT